MQELLMAASTKNFKGNLGVTYKGTVKDASGEKWFNSKITIEKVNNKKVHVKVVASGIKYGKFNGKIISKNTIQVSIYDGEKIKLKWKDKTHFTAKRPSGGFSDGNARFAKLLCYSLNNVEYTQEEQSKTVYYGASHMKRKDEHKSGVVSKITIKNNKMIVKGSFIKATSEKKLFKNKGSYL